MSDPVMHPVKSTNIAAVGHDGEGLVVQYLNGTTYHYAGCPAHHVEAIKADESPGRYIHHMIKGAHPARKIG